VEYFKCNPGCAMFVALDKLSEVLEKDGKSNTLRRQNSISNPPDIAADQNVTKLRRLSLDSAAQYPKFVVERGKVQFSTLPRGTPLSNLKVTPSYKIGDEILFYDKHNRKLSGRLRWIGESKDGLDIVGVEAVSGIQMCVNTHVYIYIVNFILIPQA